MFCFWLIMWFFLKNFIPIDHRRTFDGHGTEAETQQRPHSPPPHTPITLLPPLPAVVPPWRIPGLAAGPQRQTNDGYLPHTFPFSWLIDFTFWSNSSNFWTDPCPWMIISNAIRSIIIIQAWYRRNLAWSCRSTRSSGSGQCSEALSCWGKTFHCSDKKRWLQFILEEKSYYCIRLFV